MFQAIISAFRVALTTVFDFVPHLVAFLVIALVGWLVGLIFDKVVTGILRKIGFDRLSDRVGLTRMEQRMRWKVDSSQVLGRVVFWFIFLIFLIPAADALGVPTISNTLNIILDYLPNVFVALLALIVGVILGHFASELIGGAADASRVGNGRIIGNVVRWAIIGFACLIALEQLKIAPPLITTLFAAVMGGLALAFGLSFGLGGRDHASRLLSRGEGRLLAAQPYDPNQIVQQAQSDLTRSEQVGAQYPPSEITQPQPSTYQTPGTGTRPPTSSGYETPGTGPRSSASSDYGQQTVPPAPQGPVNPPQRPKSGS